MEPAYVLDNGVDTLEQQATDLLHSAFETDDNAKTVCAMAPGRVNLIGEHTDYNEGFVMPFALKLRTVVVAAKTTTGLVRIASVNQPGVVVEFEAASIAPGSVGSWGKYVAGVIAQYKQELPQDETISFDAAFASNVPLGAGLSSSASLEVCTATLLEGLYNITTVSGVDRALRCVQAEHDYANVPCGIMDQFVSSVGVDGHALLVDCRTKETTAVPLDDDSVSAVIANSNCTHSLSGSEYPTRVQQCKDAVAASKEHFPDKADGITHLRDVTPEMIDELFQAGKVGEEVMQRARHGTSEDVRTTQAAECLKARDFDKVGEFMKQSHDSLRDDYEVSTPELDALVEIALQVPGVFGSRMTGGGFGGSTITLVKTSQVDELVATLNKEYAQKFNIDCTCIVTRPGPGAHVVWNKLVDAEPSAPGTAEEAATDVHDSPASGSTGELATTTETAGEMEVTSEA